ncbi:MAG: glycosyltransferase family 9 protein [Myxococcales bacterium]
MGSLLERARTLGRALLLGLLRLLLPRAASGAAPVDAARIDSVLVIRTDDRVGNLLLTTPLLAALREALPRARVGLLCAARRAPAIRGTGLYDDLWAFEKRDFFVRPWRFVSFCLRLRRARYDLAIEAGHWHAFSFTAGALALWSGALVRIGHRRGEAERLLTHVVEKDPGVSYDAAAKLELLRPLGIAPARCPPLATRLGDASRARFEALYRGRPVVLVNPGGRKADHRWGADRFAAAAVALAERFDLGAWVAWGPGEEALARAVLGQAPGAELLPPTDLEGLAGAMRAAALVLTNDTGPMHLAAAVGAATVAVFLGADGARWGSPVEAFRAVAVMGLGEAEALARVIGAAAELLRGPGRSEPVPSSA